MAEDNFVFDNPVTDDNNIGFTGDPITIENPTIEQPTKDGIYGLSDTEMSDPNAIKVCISDTQTPVVVLFGPASCGKTMTLVRLTRYLNSKGYNVNPKRDFRPSYDSNYAKMCNDFNVMINSDNAAKSTSHVSFMLVEVSKSGGKPICQILEAPGELYFSLNNPNAQFPTYVAEIIRSNIRKIWAVSVEPDWLDPQDRANYVNRIRSLKTELSPNDKVLFLYNKVDKTNYVYSPGNVNMGQLIRYTEQQYPNIFDPFLNQNPITKLWRKYNCELVPFQTGSYHDKQDGEKMYVPSHENYPRNFWNMLLKLIRG